MKLFCTMPSIPDCTERRMPNLWRERLEALLLLLLLAMLLFWPAVVGGRALLPTDLIFSVDPLWQPLAPEGFDLPGNHHLSDQVYQFFPWRVFTFRSFAQGYVPLWNPYTNGGVPLIGNAQSAVFSPFSLIGSLLPLPASFVVTAILRLWVAGFFTFLFARRIGIGKHGAMLSMVAFAFSGPMIVWLGHPHSFVLAWLPAMLWATERLLAEKRSPTVSRSADIAVLGLFIAAQFLGGHPETSFHIGLAWAAYTLFRIGVLGWKKEALRHLGRVTAAALIGIALAAVQLWPFLEAMAHSETLAFRMADTSTQTWWQHLLFDWQKWPTVVTALLPRYFGVPMDKSYFYPFGNYASQYIGVLPLALALTAVFYGLRKRLGANRKYILGFVILAVVSIGIALDFPLFNLIDHLPLFNISVSQRLRMVYAFSVAILAGFGVDGLQDKTCWRVVGRVLLGLAVLNLLLNVGGYLGITLFEKDLVQMARRRIEGSWGSPYYSRPIEYYYTGIQTLIDDGRARFLPNNFWMYVPILTALAWAVLRWWKKKSGMGWRYLVWGIAAVDLVLAGWAFHPTTAVRDIFPEPDAVRFVRQDAGLYRMSGMGMVLYPNSGMMFGLADVRGYDTVVSQRYVDLYDRIRGTARFTFHSLLVDPQSPLLDLLNVKYVLADRPLDGRWELAYDDGTPVKVYRNPDVLPRAFVVYRAEIVDGAARSLARTTDGAFDFRGAVVLEETPAGWGEPPAVDEAPVVRITGYRPNRVSIEVETTRDGLLVLTDTFAPGWKARVDGQKTKVYVADHAFRAVVVPAGAHQVEFVYQPSSFWGGAAISLVTAIVVTIVLVIFGRKR